MLCVVANHVCSFLFALDSNYLIFLCTQQEVKIHSPCTCTYMDTDSEFSISIHVAFVRRRQANDKILSQSAVAPTAMSLASSCKSDIREGTRPGGREGQLERHVRLFFQFMQRCFPLQVKSPRRGMFKQSARRERGM